MLNDADTIQRYPLRHPLRHPANTNLHLYYEDTFEGFPLMRDKGPFIREYLSDLKRTIELALAEHPRVLAFRVDLRLPQGIELPDYAYTNCSGQPIPDSGLSFSSATAGGNPSLN
ncbi:inovirus Gp2 family protein [Pseudomonas aeruginosa]|nr:inovirus Gp2 family protein [Pseudomonas aeruginosa]